MRDHMMGWAIPAEPLGPAIRPIVASKAACEAYLVDDAVRRFETGDHMLPGMKQSDFPKEYDTRVAIEDRALGAYEKAMREMLIYGCSKPVVFGYDEAKAAGGTVFAKLTKEKCDAASQRLMDELCGVPAVLRGDRAASQAWLKATEVPWPGSSAMTPEHKAAQHEKNRAAAEIMLKTQAAEQRMLDAEWDSVVMSTRKMNRAFAVFRRDAPNEQANLSRSSPLSAAQRRALGL